MKETGKHGSLLIGEDMSLRSVCNSAVLCANVGFLYVGFVTNTLPLHIAHRIHHHEEWRRGRSVKAEGLG